MIYMWAIWFTWAASGDLVPVTQYVDEFQTQPECDFLAQEYRAQSENMVLNVCSPLGPQPE